MKYVQFDYVNKFSCLAGKCPDTCCKDWQIILDEDAMARYRAMPGELGEQVRAAMLTENSETRFREQDGKCVLLREDRLCPIQAAYGAEALCRTCFTHPRFTEEYGQTAELTLSVSCPEAARLLLEHEAPLQLETTDDGGPVVPNELDPTLYMALLSARTAAIRLAQERERPFADRLALVLLLARRVQRLLDEGREELVPVLARRFGGRGYQDRSLVRLARLRSRAGRFFPCCQTPALPTASMSRWIFLRSTQKRLRSAHGPYFCGFPPCRCPTCCCSQTRLSRRILRPEHRDEQEQ